MGREKNAGVDSYTKVETSRMSVGLTQTPRDLSARDQLRVDLCVTHAVSNEIGTSSDELTSRPRDRTGVKRLW